MVIVASVLALAAQGLRFVRFGAIDPDLVTNVVQVVRWLPPGMLGHAIFDAHEGSYALAAVETAAPALLVPVLLGVWGNALDRALTVVTGGLTEGRRGRHRDEGSLALLFERLPFIPATPMGAVASRDLRYVLRDPKRKVVLVNSVLIGIGLPIYLAVTGSGVSPGTVLLSSVAGFIALFASMNQFGFDGAALWIDVIAGNRVRDEIVGKNVSLAVQVFPVMVAVGLLLAALSGGWAYLPASLVIGLAGLGAGLAVSDVVSVRYPQRVPETRNPFGGGGAGQGCAAGLVAMLGLLLQQLILAPVGIVGVVIAFAGPAVSIVLAPLVAIYGYVVWRAGVNSAARWLFWHQPELLNAVDPRRRD
jgi:ABC-2 type transport system permease protein